ncbi:MAG: hypothetical protein KJ922_03765, partial [Nanoarchaeota archaeon]|nr:hypothetical protein [Nanoarchaeota archaeon]
LILYSIIYSIMITLAVVAYGHITAQINAAFYLLTYSTNIILASVAAILFWLVHLWSAGDAKLFIAYTFLLPLNIFKLGYEPNFPAMAVLINVFVPLFLFYFCSIIFRQSAFKTLTHLKKAFDTKKLLTLLVSFFAVSWPLYYLGQLTNLFSNLFVSVISIFLIMSALEFFLPGKGFIGMVAISIVRLFLDSSIHNSFFWQQFLYYFVGYFILRFFILGLSFGYFTREEFIENLKPGMMTAQRIVKEKGKFLLEDAFITNIFEGLKKNKDKEEVLPIKSLSNEDIIFIKKHHSDGNIKEHKVKVQEFVSFALFMFIGVLITLICQGNLLVFLVKFFP